MIDLNKIRVHEEMVFHFRKSTSLLSDLLDNRQRLAIYYEPSFHKPINNFIIQHYDEIYRRLISNGIVFVYYPMLLKDLYPFLQFNFPDSGQISDFPSSVEFYNNITASFVEKPSTERPMLLFTDFRIRASHTSDHKDDDVANFTSCDLDYVDDNQFKYALRHYLPPERFDTRRRRDDTSSASMVCCEESAVYGFDADKESIEIMWEIQERIDKLYAKGVPEKLLKQFLSLPEPKPSRLLITEDFRLLLPDYNNREIVLNPLPKALYFFYLRHSEGVLFKHLRDHRDEIFDLYSLLSPSENLDRMNQSIDDLVDSTKNSVNVLCSRIKTAFASQFKDDLARQYYITGAAGEPKRIALDRKLVEDRSGLIMGR